MVKAPCTGSQILLTARLAKHRVLSAGAHHRESLAQDLEVPFEEGLQNQEPGSHPTGSRAASGKLSFLAPILAGTEQRVGSFLLSLQ